MAECAYCGQPCAGKYCSGNACKTADWSESRDFGHALKEDGVVSREDVRVYLAVRDAARRACNEAGCAGDVAIDLRSRLGKGAREAL